MKCVIICIAVLYLSSPVISKTKIAIVGAGIGGTSCAYFLHELFGDNVEIDIYEKSTVGGRLATVRYNSEEYETGGAIIHERNKYMGSFVDKFGLERRVVDNSSSGGQIAILNGSTTEFVTSEWKIITILKLFWRYGFSLYRLDHFISNMLNSFDRIYKLQSKMITFETVPEMLNSMNPKFSSYLDTSTNEGFKNYGKMDDRIILELAQATLRVNYGQTTDVQTFVGAVSVAGTKGGSLWSVNGGNKLVAEKCLYNSKANLYNFKVNKIIKNTDDDKFIIELVDNGDRSTTIIGRIQYDAVIIAAPITDDTRAGMEFVNFTDQIKVPGRYHRTVATILKGRLNASRFEQFDNVDCLINLDTNDIFNSLGVIKSVSGTDKTNLEHPTMWKIFSQRNLTDEEINSLFDDSEVIDVVDWLAYPHYAQKRDHNKDSFVLSDKLYYINAVEWAASAMEMSVIAAKNVALLLFKRLSSTSASTSITTSTQRVELR